MEGGVWSTYWVIRNRTTCQLSGVLLFYLGNLPDIPTLSLRAKVIVVPSALSLSSEQDQLLSNSPGVIGYDGTRAFSSLVEVSGCHLTAQK